jgi:Protein ENHANCED DISEASE RESISTANCE 2, C-terminal
MQLKEGSWLMRQTMGSTPVLIGTKLGTTYHRGPNYLEVTVDISSNSTAASITNVLASAVSSLSIWLAFVLEGRRAEHLPERILGTLSISL